MNKNVGSVDIYFNPDDMVDSSKHELKNMGAISEYDIAKISKRPSNSSNPCARSQISSNRKTKLSQSSPTILRMVEPSLAEVSLHTAGTEEKTDPFPTVTTLPIHPTITSSDIDEAARRFSNLSSPHIIVELCLANIPDWHCLEARYLEVGQLLIGLSNQLFSVQLSEDCPEREKFPIKNVLFRIYGKDVNSLYDSSTEIRVFKALTAWSVAPKLHCEFEGGRIEEWIEGGTLDNKDMATSRVIVAVAAILANIHSLDLSNVIDTTPCVDKYLKRWTEGAMQLYKAVDISHPSYLDFQRLELEKLFEESYKLRDYLLPKGTRENPVTTISFCHNDIQENNIMVTQDSMRLIDFEYSGYNYPAYDIASYFWEMTCDYTVPYYPFFQIDPTRYPSLEKRRLFCTAYLKNSLNTQDNISPQILDEVIDSIERFQLAAHLLWGLWAVIRAPQAATVTTFDMLYYGQKRFNAYWAQKAKLLAEQKIFN